MQKIQTLEIENYPAQQNVGFSVHLANDISKQIPVRYQNPREKEKKQTFNIQYNKIGGFSMHLAALEINPAQQNVEFSVHLADNINKQIPVRY